MTAATERRRSASDSASGTAPSGTPAAAALLLDVLIESPLWEAEPEAEAVARRALEAAAQRLGTGGEVSLVLADDAAVQVLNRTWRGIDKPTNVLSFPAPAAPAGPVRMLGDIAVAYETLRREAAAEGKSFAHHLAHLVVHGLLHLLGYDHETDSEAEIMERLETAILAELGVSDPYAARDSED